MKKLKAFLENNYKKISVISILLGFYLIIKLFLFGADSICGSSGFISICVVPDIEYTWTNAGYISIIFLIISIILFITLIKTKDKIKKVQIAFLILILGFIGKPLFYLVSPEFKFYENGEKSYSDKDGNVTNMDKYLESMGKYCDNSIDNFKMGGLRRSDWCSGQYLYDFKTAEDYAKVFDYANKHNLEHLYKLTFRSANDFGLEKIIKVYHDDTFYAYLIYNRLLSEDMKKILKTTIKNEKILDLLNYYNNFKLHIIELGNSDYQDWEKFDNEIYEKIKQIPEVNYKVF